MSNRRKSRGEKVVKSYGLDRCPECRSWLLFRRSDGGMWCENRHEIFQGTNRT